MKPSEAPDNFPFGAGAAEHIAPPLLLVAGFKPLSQAALETSISSRSALASSMRFISRLLS